MNDDSIFQFFLHEDADSERTRALREQAELGTITRREALAAALTVREPTPIPGKVLAALERLLAEERAARGVVEMAQLLSLQDEGWDDVNLPTERIFLWRGDLTRLACSAITNAANSSLLGCRIPGHLCIDNAIHAAAGPRLRAACAEHIARQGYPEPSGHAVLTEGFQLPTRYVIHTVGPIVQGKPSSEDEATLRSCYLSILNCAESHPKIDSVGLCSISTGVFGYPKKEAASIVFDVISQWHQKHPVSDLSIVVSLFEEVDEHAYRQALVQRRVVENRV